MTFREKSAVAQLAAIAVVFGFFGYIGVRHQADAQTLRGTVGILMGITMGMIAVSIVSHIAIALYTRPEKPDERDRIVELRGHRNGYLAMGVGVWCVLLLTVAQRPYSTLCYAILGAFAVAEIIRLASQLYYYRVG